MAKKENKNRIFQSSNSINEISISDTGKRIKYRLARPLDILVYSDSDLCFVENKNLALIGTGNSFSAAFEDFCRYVIHFYNYYNMIAFNKITGDAIRLKKNMRSYLLILSANDFDQTSEDI